MTRTSRAAAWAALLALACANVPAFADDHAYTEGPVVSVAMIRTADGRFDDYMQWLDTTWKAEQEAAKKAGYIESYEVLMANPQGPNDPGDEIAKKVEGSVGAANQAEADRSKIRRVLGSQMLQVARLK